MLRRRRCAPLPRRDALAVRAFPAPTSISSSSTCTRAATARRGSPRSSTGVRGARVHQVSHCRSPRCRRRSPTRPCWSCGGWRRGSRTRAGRWFSVSLRLRGRPEPRGDLGFAVEIHPNGPVSTWFWMVHQITISANSNATGRNLPQVVVSPLDTSEHARQQSGHTSGLANLKEDEPYAHQEKGLSVRISHRV